MTDRTSSACTPSTGSVTGEVTSMTAAGRSPDFGDFIKLATTRSAVGPELMINAGYPHQDLREHSLRVSTRPNGTSAMEQSQPAIRKAPAAWDPRANGLAMTTARNATVLTLTACRNSTTGWSPTPGYRAPGQ